MYARSTDNLQIESNVKENITAKLAIPDKLEVVDVLTHVSKFHANLPWLYLKKRGSNEWEKFTYDYSSDLTYVTSEKKLNYGYLYRDGSDELAWFFDKKGQRHTSGWTPFPMAVGMIQHQQAEVSSKKYDISFMVDEGIAPIMQFLLDRDIYTEQSCECHRLTTYPFDGLFGYISVATFLKGTADRPHTERLQSITATELVDVLGLVQKGDLVRQWRINGQNTVLIFNPDAVVLGN